RLRESSMESVFVSHVAEDAWFVNLLVKVLKFHELEVAASSGHEPGVRQRKEPTLATAHNLVVVVSNHSLTSAAVSGEIAVFRDRQPGGRIIALTLDSSSPAGLLESG